MKESKFKNLVASKFEMTEEEWRVAYPELTDEQIKTLIKGEANEPSRKSIFSFTKADK